jgi:predicted AlkP superfamily phosphohydrolase/phosphomutase
MELIETQTAAAAYLITTRPVDFFMTVYTASDWAGHNLWRGPEVPPGENKLLEVYRALDGAIERLLHHANAETQVYVISDHGMGPHTGASYQLAEWLESRSYMIRRGRSHACHSIIKASRRAARTLLPASVRERVKAGIGDERVGRLQAAEKDSFYSSIDWPSTVAYSEPGRHVININLQGRNPAGKVPQSAYDEVCSRIIDGLGKWRDRVGNKVVDRVVRREEVYAGPLTERASDLYVYWNPDARLGEPPDEVRNRGFWWSGDHRPEGILICKGPGLNSTVLEAPATVYDLVPTMMYAAALPVPDALDGSVIQGIFTREVLEARPVRVEHGGSLSTADPVKLSPEEERLVEDKLRGLGYL